MQTRPLTDLKRNEIIWIRDNNNASFVIVVVVADAEIFEFSTKRGQWVTEKCLQRGMSICFESTRNCKQCTDGDSWRRVWNFHGSEFNNRVVNLRSSWNPAEEAYGDASLTIRRMEQLIGLVAMATYDRRIPQHCVGLVASEVNFFVPLLKTVAVRKRQEQKLQIRAEKRWIVYYPSIKRDKANKKNSSYRMTIYDWKPKIASTLISRS